MYDRDRQPGVPPKPNEKPNPLPFLKPPPKPSTRVHTSETTINGKTYETITVETPYGSTTTTKEKTAKQWEQEERAQKAVDIMVIVLGACIAIFFFLVCTLNKRGL